MHVGIDEVIDWATRNRSTLENEAAAILGPEEYRNAEDLVQQALMKIVKAFAKNPDRIERKPKREETNKVLLAYLTTTMLNQRLDDLEKRKITERDEDGVERIRWVKDHLTDKLPEQLHEEPYEDPWLPYVEVDPRPTTRRLPPIPPWFRGIIDQRCPKCRKFLALLSADPDTDPQPEAARRDPGRADLHDVRAAVRRAVSRDLTPRQAQAVFYVFWEDLEQVDVAELWGRKPATVNVTMGDARKRLLANADVQRAWQATRRPSQRTPVESANIPAPRTPAPAHPETELRAA
ncbi:MAG: hypothetical protein HOY79_18940 [Streptomyces sp.]|nr:hypothetical protein [Streptomyces sp.]